MNDAFGISTASAERPRVCMEEFCPARVPEGSGSLPPLPCRAIIAITAITAIIAIIAIIAITGHDGSSRSRE